jgi:hypothetical protein
MHVNKKVAVLEHRHFTTKGGPFSRPRGLRSALPRVRTSATRLLLHHAVMEGQAPMATYYVVCINKHPTHSDPHRRIESVGTNELRSAATYSKKWSVDQVIAAIRRGDTFYSTDARGDIVLVEIATHNGHEYIKTKADGIQPDNLLRKPECN